MEVNDEGHRRAEERLIERSERYEGRQQIEIFALKTMQCHLQENTSLVVFLCEKTEKLSAANGARLYATRTVYPVGVASGVGWFWQRTTP